MGDNLQFSSVLFANRHQKSPLSKERGKGSMLLRSYCLFYCKIVNLGDKTQLPYIQSFYNESHYYMGQCFMWKAKCSETIMFPLNWNSSELMGPDGFGQCIFFSL